MLSKILRLAAAALFLALAVWQFIEGHIGNGILMLLLMGIAILLFYRHERMLLALWHLRKQNMEKAEHQLDKIKRPEKTLVKGQLAYWYMLKGMAQSQHGLGKAESFLRKSLSTGLRMKHDQAMAKLQLAGIAIAKRRKREAMILMSDVKKLDTRGMLTDQVKMMKQQMKRI